MKLLAYLVFAVQARLLHKRYGVRPEYMEIVLRIEWHRKREHWNEWRYQRELQILAARYPDDAARHLLSRQKEEH